MTTMTLQRPAPVRRPDSLRGRLAERRLLARRDQLAARLLELWHIAELTGQARAVVESGWIQRSWYRYDEDRRGDRSTRGPVVGACLAGAIVQAGGGPAAFNTQLVQRTLDLTWNTLYGVDGDSLARCPAPSVRIMHLRDLIRWNDQPARTRAEVADLMAATGAEAGRLSDLVRSCTP
jgi:hypothetical protein